MIKMKLKAGILILITLITFVQVGYAGSSIETFGTNQYEDINEINSIIDKPSYIEGEYVVKYKDNIKQHQRIALQSNRNIRVVKSFDNVNVELVQISGKTNEKNTIRDLKRNPSIEYIEPNYLYYPMEPAFNESRFDELWGLYNTGQEIRGNQGMPGVDINTLELWRETKGNEDIIVAVIDTGIDISHPDLVERIWINPNETLNGVDDDENGYIDDVYGWDFFNDSNIVFNQKDGDTHGTHVAGIIAASLNEKGIVGVAPNIKIMPLKFLGPDNKGGATGSLSDAISAIDYAKEKGVKIVNASWGSYFNSEILKSAIENSGMLFIAAAGNENKNNDITPAYPASYDLPNILSVAAVNNRGDLSGFSNYGFEKVFVAAPGEDILSTIPFYRNMTTAVQNDTERYKVFFQGFGLEKINQESNREDILHRVMSFLEVKQESKVLIVQDDENNDPIEGNCLYAYLNPLIKLGYTNYEVATVEQHQPGPDYETMKEYDAIIWFTGNGYGKLDKSIVPITPTDSENLVKYLENGGKLYLSGRDAGLGIENTDFYTKYLGAKFIEEIDEGEIKTKYMAVGEAGTDFYKGVYYFTDSTLSDFILPNTDTAKAAITFLVSSRYDNPYAYSSGTSMAAPYVTGIAALLNSMEIDDILSIKSLIMRSTDEIDSLNGNILTGGIVNADKALELYREGKTRYVTDIKLSKDIIQLDTTIENEYNLYANVFPYDADDKRIVWISSDDKVATVDEYGVVRAMSSGQAIIKGISVDGGYTDTCEVNVTENDYPAKISEIKLTNELGIEKDTFKEGESIFVDVNIKHSLKGKGSLIIKVTDSKGRAKLIDVKEILFLELENSEKLEITTQGEGIYTIEVFLWDNLKNMKPLSESGKTLVSLES